ncbi:MAG: alpha/beta hydrolase [Patescibacteria group bacterium]
MPPTLLILPGWGDSGPQHWQSLWLKKFPNAIKVEQKDWDFPKKNDWVKALNESIEKHIEKHQENEIILVGHSIGSPLIAFWAKEYFPHSKAKIKGALLISPSDTETPDFPKEIQGFAPVPREKIPFKTIAVVSSDDKLVSAARAEDFAKSWGAELINIGPHGHINTDAGFGEWVEGEELLKKIIR